MEDEKKGISVSKVMDYIYCPRNIFFMDVLGIEKNEKSYKVKTGKDIHNEKLRKNKFYLRKDLKVVKKEMNVTLSSKKNMLYGKVDEILFLRNNTIVPLDYKYSEYTGKIYDTYKYQLSMYSMMIDENYKVKSRKGYIVFIRADNKIIEVEYGNKEFEQIKKYLKNIREIRNKGYYPLEVEESEKCDDCYYKKLCIRG